MTLLQLTANGLIRPTLDQIVTDMLDRLAARVEPIHGEPIRRDGDSVILQIYGPMCGAIDEYLQGTEAVHHAFDPRDATGASEDALCALNDTRRKPASASFGTYYPTGDATTLLLAGDVVTNPAADLRYQLTLDVTLVAATARTTTQVVTAGQVMSNAGGCYFAVTGGTTGGGAGPSGTTAGAQEADGTVVWAYLGPGLAYGTTMLEALATGPVAGPAFSLSRPGTVRSGWRGGANAEDVTRGRDVEGDEVLRVRRLAELHGPGKAAVDAIRSAFTRRSDVNECVVFENVELTTDGDGIPGKAVEVVLDGSISDADAAQVLLEVVAAGIKTHGTTTVSIADERGFLHSVQFSRAVEVDVYARVTVIAERQRWPAQPDPSAAPMTVGEVAARAAVLAYGAALALGLNVRHSRVEAAVFLALIPGTLGVSLQLDTVAITTQPPADVVISLRQRGKLDSSRITVAVTYEDP